MLGDLFKLILSMKGQGGTDDNRAEVALFAGNAKDSQGTQNIHDVIDNNNYIVQ